jgi:uncharacterized cupin superfamily protein
MPVQSRLVNAAAIAASELEDWGPVPVPIGTPVSQLRGRVISANADGSEAGVWEIRETTRKSYLTYKPG